MSKQYIVMLELQEHEFDNMGYCIGITTLDKMEYHPACVNPLLAKDRFKVACKRMFKGKVHE